MDKKDAKKMEAQDTENTNVKMTSSFAPVDDGEG